MKANESSFACGVVLGIFGYIRLVYGVWDFLIFFTSLAFFGIGLWLYNKEKKEVRE